MLCACISFPLKLLPLSSLSLSLSLSLCVCVCVCVCVCFTPILNPLHAMAKTPNQPRYLHPQQ